MLILPTGEREYRIWVSGFPKSQQSGSFSRYREAIRNAAQRVFGAPLASLHIEMEIVFADKKRPRPDVDNVTKPVLDALKGVVYYDDVQVVSAKVNLIPVCDDLRIVNGRPHNTFVRLFDTDQFLICVRERLPAAVGYQVTSS